ncbi:MAG: hypothetical protein Q4G71_16020 [Pseudomonadota bacterium]|nr:hypothetical protein [Pseudomonadota bacterium]
MNVMIVGSSGMVGQGVLRACLRAADVRRIVLPVRKAPAALPPDPRIELVRLPDLMQLDAGDARLAGLDACFFCAGVSSAGMNEADYRKVTLDLTAHTARQMAAIQPDMCFVYISGAGADSTEKSKTMWKRVRGETENLLLASPLKATVFRPAFILAEEGIRSQTLAYEAMYTVMRPLMRVLGKVLPLDPLTTADIGNAMLQTVRRGDSGQVLQAKAIQQRART